MKTHLRFLWCCAALLCVAITSRGQLSGPITVPSTTYPTLAVAIDSLNRQGVGGTGVVVTVNANETAPVGGYQLGSAILNASTSSGKKVVINGTGKTLTAYVGTSTTTDGIFYIQGTDYVEINNLNLAESSANTTNTTQMEWGYSLVKLSSSAPYDGCQYVKINGCTITLSATNPNTIGIRGAHTQVASTSTLSTSSVTPASTNSYCEFTANTISGVTRGISLVGINNGAVAYDKANKIGGTAAATGNTISVGGSTNTSYAIYTQYDSVITISSNQLSIATGQNASVYLINPNTGVGDLTVTNNTMNIACAMTSSTVYGYYNSQTHKDASSGTSAASTHTITGNTVRGNNTTATSSSLYAFYEYFAYCRTLNYTNNTIRDVDWNTSSGTMYLHYIYYSYATTKTVSDNLITNFDKRSSSGFIYGIYVYDPSAPAGTSAVLRNTVRGVRQRYYIYPIYVYGSTVTNSNNVGQHKLTVQSNVVDSIDMSAATSTAYCYNYFLYYGGDSSVCNDNVVSNIYGGTSTTYVSNYFAYYGYYAPGKWEARRNRVENIQAPGTYLYNNNYFAYYGTLADSNVVYKINATGTGGYSSNDFCNSRDNSITSNNRIQNISFAGSGYMYGYMNMYCSGTTIRNNVIDSIAYVNGTSYPFYTYPYGACTISGNRVSNIYLGGSPTIYGMYLSGSNPDFTLYNNFVTNINVPSGYANTSACGIYCYSYQNTSFRLYHNTIRINPGVPAGFTGILYDANSALDLRNNIINVNATPTGSGFTVALRRSTGTAGTPPVNFLASSNANIYYTPTAANSHLYAEGSSAAGLVNAYNITNDPNFNTPCGLFKNFVSHDFSSFTENNLIAGPRPATYVPTGVSFAEKGAVPTPSNITVDHVGTTRGALADIGALEFTGVALDQAPPVISFTPVTKQSYCVTTPSIVATITDVTGVNNTTGSAPRLYYKKSNGAGNDANVFTAANNSTGNGWKYVEATSVTGNQYTFNFDYSLLRSAVVPGDSLTYFIIAQDNAATPNTGFNLAAFSLCPGSVNLSGTNGGVLKDTPIANGFRILSTPVFRVDAFPAAACQSGSTTLSIRPVPVGTTVQWQTATLTGTFSDITGATSPTYTTPVQTTSVRYRAVIFCGSSTLATTTIDTFIIAKPAILSTAGMTTCGFGPSTLTATTAPFSVGKWYDAPTGGNIVAVGNTFVTPPISSTRTYYVSAVTANANVESPGPTRVNYSWDYSPGTMSFEFKNAFTDFYSTTVYPWTATPGSTVDLDLVDSNGNSMAAYPTFTFTIAFAGNGSTPQVVNLPWRNIPRGKYTVNITPNGTGAKMHMYYSLGAPLTSPSGATVITGGTMYSSTNYLAYLYNNIFGADCESATRVPVVATVTPAPPIAASSPNTPGICLGAGATLNVASANPDYVYTWTPGTATGTAVSVTPTVTTTYRVTAVDPYTGCRAVDSIKLFVNAQPAPPTITPNPATICAGKSVQLNGNPPLGSAGVGQIGTTASSSSSYPTPWGALYTGAHTQYLYTQAELATMGIFPGHLITSYAVYSTSAGGNMQNFTIQLGTTTATSTSGSMFCPTGSGQLTLVHYLASYTPPSSGWVTFSFNQSAYTYTGGTLIVDITHMNCATCPTSSCNSWTSNGGIAVTSTTNNMVNYAYADGNCAVTTCNPSYTYTSTQRASAQFGFRQPADINWLVVTDLYKNSGLTTPVTLTDTIRYPYAAPSTTTVYRAITNLQGCKSLPSAPDTVFVVPSPDATITPAGKQTICAGQTVTMCVPTAVNQTYQWTRNGVAIAGATSNCYTATSAGAYGVTVSNLLSGCSRTSLNDTVIVNPAPTVTVTRRGASVICKGLTDTLIAAGTNIVSYQWKESGVNIPGATSNTLAVTTSGVYTVEVTNTDGCTATSASETITVNVTPTTITPLGPTTFCNGNNVTLQAPAAPAGVTFTYQWRQGGVNITGATGSSYTASTTGSYTVVVTNTTTGCRDSSVATVVNVGPPPSSQITPNGNVVLCTNGSVTLTAASSTQTGLSYQWFNGTTAISGATNPTYTATAAGTYSVRVSITSTPTCASQGDNNAVLTLTPLPTAVATAAGPVNFCQGGSVVINAAAGTGLTYQWNLNNAPIAGQTGSSITVTTSGSYSYSVTNTATGCSNVSNAIAVTVSQPPVSTVTPSGATTFCQGGNVNLCVPTGAASYAWRLNGNPITGATSACYTATATGIYSVTVGGGNGCSVTSAPTSVQVNALPNVTTVPTGAAAVCQGYSIALTVGNDPNYSYQWLLNNVNITNNAQSATYNASAAGTYKVRVTNNITGCSAVSADIVLSVNTPPTATATLVGPSKICQADSTRIDATTGPGFMYQWRLNGVNIAGATNATYYAKQSGSYTVNVSNATNCFNISNPIVITVDPRPAAYITYATPLEFCEGSAVVLTANPGQGLTYEWQINGTPNGNTDIYNVSKTSGRYALKVTNNYGCTNTSDTLNVVVYPAPVPTIVRNGSSLETSTPYISYQWFLNNDAIGGATSQSYAYNQNGAYKVRVIDMYGCEGTSNLFFVTNVGVGNTAVGKSIRIYPNPTTALINIDASVKVKVVLRDVAGKSVLEASDVKQINLGDIANGMYMLYISDMNGILLRAEKVTKTAN